MRRPGTMASSGARRERSTSGAVAERAELQATQLVLLGCLLVLGGLTVALFVSSARAAALSCPASTTLTPGSQDSASTAVLYCGGTYMDTWDAQGESDWIAFYTTNASATVVAHYSSTDTSGDEEHPVKAVLFNPGSATESLEELSPEGPVSAGNLELRGLSYTFSAPGLHYVEMTTELPNYEVEGTGYQLSLSGEWSQTPPPPSSPPAPAPPPACVVPSLGNRRLGSVERRIRAGHCTVGLIRHVHSRLRRGQVIALSSRSGTRLTSGAFVAIVVSSGPKDRRRRRAGLASAIGQISDAIPRGF